MVRCVVDSFVLIPVGWLVGFFSVSLIAVYSAAVQM